MTYRCSLDGGPAARGIIRPIIRALGRTSVVTYLAALLLAPALQAAEIKVGTWQVGETDDGTFFAYTLNDSGHVFGQWCDPDEQACFWMLGIETKCDASDDGTYPVLVNSTTGAASLEVGCVGPLGDLSIHRYAFADFDRIEAIAREAKNVGFAFPLESGRFVVERFDLRGSARALDLMQEMAMRGFKGATGTKSQIM